MSSFIETTEQATTEMHDLNSKILSLVKTYTFFLFYDYPTQKSTKTQSVLSNIDFKLKQQKSSTTCRNESNSIQEQTKQIQIHFYDLNNQNDILQGISDLRNHSFSNKAKLVINASEQKLSYLIEQFQQMKVDLASVPIVISSNQYQSDISTFLGWKSNFNESMASQNLHFYHELSNQWIKAATEKIDLWQASITVSKQKGRILKVVNGKLNQIGDQNLKYLQEYFISHLCIGYHAGLMLSCSEKIKGNQETIGNSIITAIQKFKKFCCVGSKNMKATTGIANISLIDDKGEQLQILKQLRPIDSSEQQSQSDFKTSKYKQYKDVLSILLTNINIYQNNPLQKTIEGKISDGKLQLLTFDSQKGHRKICSAQSEVKIKLDTEIVDLQVGQSIYRLEYPEEIRVSFKKKIKIAIHNQLVRC